MLFSGFMSCLGDRLLFMSTAKPASGDLTGNGYAGGLNSALNTGVVYKVTSGALTNLSATNLVGFTAIGYGVAMLFDAGTVRYFYRLGSYDWSEGTFKTDATYTALRYCGVRMNSGGSLALGPVGIYYDP
jgi:hypothetical protein